MLRKPTIKNNIAAPNFMKLKIIFPPGFYLPSM